MSVTTHPLAEIIAKKLFNIETEKPDIMRKKVGNAIKAAIEYHQNEINMMLLERGDSPISYEEIDDDMFNKIIISEWRKGNQYLDPNFFV